MIFLSLKHKRNFLQSHTMDREIRHSLETKLKYKMWTFILDKKEVPKRGIAHGIICCVFVHRSGTFSTNNPTNDRLLKNVGNCFE